MHNLYVLYVHAHLYGNFQKLLNYCLVSEGQTDFNAIIFYMFHTEYSFVKPKPT